MAAGCKFELFAMPVLQEEALLQYMFQHVTAEEVIE